MGKEEKIIISIDKDGKLSADAKNFEGNICLKEMKKILEDFPDIEDIDRKPEFFKQKHKTAHKTTSKQNY